MTWPSGWYPEVRSGGGSMNRTETTQQSPREEGTEGEVPAPPPGRVGRAPYRPPRLTIYGRLADLTRFGGSQVVDSGGIGNIP